MNSSNKKILIIDDLPEIIEKFGQFFNGKGIETDTFLSTQSFYVETQARDLSAYALVFIDYHLPEETGVDFIDRFDKTSKLPSTFLITGDPLIEGNVKNKPHIVVLNKPINLEKLWEEELSFLF